MKSLVEQVNELKEAANSDFAVVQAMEDINYLKSLGLLKPPVYSIPLKDTIGKRNAAKSKKKSIS